MNLLRQNSAVIKWSLLTSIEHPHFEQTQNGLQAYPVPIYSGFGVNNMVWGDLETFCQLICTEEIPIPNHEPIAFMAILGISIDRYLFL